MGLLVSFNGQFSPHQRVNKIPADVPHVNEVQRTRPVTEFREILAENGEVTESHGHKSPSRIDAYSSQKKTFQEQRKYEHARDIMSSPVKVIHEKAPLSEARQILEKNGFRHLPVVNDHKVVVGIISDRELLCAREMVECHEAMINKLLVCEEHTSIREISVTLLEERINALPVINKNRELVGIITLTDILEFVVRTTPFLGRA